jgi:murein DD-endopeptidase MepM/ murein hydrolase activator NlpD
MAGNYALPTNTDYVSCSHACHKNRNPCSTEPGTDYGSAYGSPLYAPGNGKIVDVKNTNSNATGRYITIDLDDGRRTRSLHLSTTGSAAVGQRVSRGQAISGAKTGASGYGSDWGYGAHVHQTLWSTHAYNFCCSCTLDFALYVGSTAPSPTQRVTGPNGANGRENPNTQGPATQFLEPGVVANMDGWIRGESVDGNNVWFRGAVSGDFFWSGGFTDKGTHDLKDLNTAGPTPTQRMTGANGANGRSQPNTTVPVTQTLAPNTIGNFDGWINGEAIDNNKVWFRGSTSGDFFWSGGFTDTGTHNLADLNPPTPTTPTRTVASPNPANIRALPYTSSPTVGSEDSGKVIEMQGFTHAEAVDSNDVWFQRKSDGKWMWSGGFTSTATTGLTEKPTPDPPAPVDEDNPRGLPEYTPIWSLAFQGLEAPLGFLDCQDPDERALRNTSGSIPVTPIIDTYIIHWTGGTADQMDYFSWCNDRSVCPTMYMRRDGSQSEMIRPGAKPAATGPQWNWRSFAVETLGGPGADFTDEQWEAHAQNIALLAEYDGDMLDGVPVSFKIDRDHVLGHREALPGTTECPGDAQIAGLDALLERAQEIYDDANPTDPCAGCDECCEDCPECPECPDPTTPIDYDRIAQEVNDEAARRRQGWT